jgi:signal transduction histidine kinase
MKTKNIDQVELLRLKTLESYKILNTEPEETYDNIARLATLATDMPIALISLIGDKGLFFKSKIGVEIDETILEDSICYHALLSNEETFEVSDLIEDKRFQHSPLLERNPYIISYFGVVLQSRDGVPFGTLCVMSKDEPKLLSKEKKQILKQLANQLVNLLELRKQNFELNNHKDEIEFYSKQMEEFAHTAAHDLRAPLRAIKSFLQLIEMKRSNELDEKEKKYFEFINTNVDTMNQLIIDLLDYAKSDAKIDEKELIDLNEFVEQIFYSLVEKHHLSNSNLAMKLMPTVNYPKAAMHIIFHNLIDNALKYRSQDRIFKLKIDYKSDNLNHYFEIEDNGIGISSDYLEVIFKPFKRLHAKSQYTGTGLGLSTANKIIQKFGGSISVNSILDRGSKFTIRIPKE